MAPNLFAPKCHLKRRLTTFLYASYAKLHLCIFAWDAVDLWYQVYFLLVSGQTIIFTVKKIHENCCLFWLRYQPNRLVAGAYSAPPDPLVVYRGLLLRKERRGREGHFSRWCLPQTKIINTPLSTVVIHTKKRKILLFCICYLTML